MLRPTSIPDDSPERIRTLRRRLGLTQVELAQRLGVSFVTVNRWENSQSRPSALAWEKLQRLDGSEDSVDGQSGVGGDAARGAEMPMDFTGAPEAVRAVTEGERLSFGHLFNPVFATEVSRIDPLPHQRLAVYDHMLGQSPLRFLLADDAGAGKTIMSGLYIREMIARRLVRRVLIVPPAGLVGNWLSEMRNLFSLSFRIVSGSDARNGNPFAGEDSDRLIVSVDTLAGIRMFARLQDPTTEPYDLVIFDEAHKLSADRGQDMCVRKTDRYCLAEALAGAPGRKPEWALPWAPTHLLLLTATPHMGKEYPYYALWRLLSPIELSTPEALDTWSADLRARHFIRRTKEEMVTLSGKPLYPRRLSDTLGYDLTQGEVSEQRLYDETTEYMRTVYNRAKLLNRSAARLAMSVLQRRLASSTYALLRSLERRLDKLDQIIIDVQSGKISIEQMITLQRRLADEVEDILDTRTADEEDAALGAEQHEAGEVQLLGGVIALTLGDLLAEREQVAQLETLATRVHAAGGEAKFEKLREVIADPLYDGEKMIVFTEHRDTLQFLTDRLNGLGYTGRIAMIHGGMPYTERQDQVEFFRKPVAAGGARFMICTDAAAEGINLQFCWRMINYDVPWNPARLEQRMGRIHRYGQKHDPVVILNLIAPKTREGRVLEVLLTKLESIRKELNSDKVFDSIGRLFEGVSIKQYMEQALVEGADGAASQLGGRLTKEQVQAMQTKETALYGAGGDVVRELPRLRESLEREVYRRLLPGYTRSYLQSAAPLVHLELTEDAPGDSFTLGSTTPHALDPILPVLEQYPPEQRMRFVVTRPPDLGSAVWMHPGEPVFEAFRELVRARLGAVARRGAVFVDPAADKPYLFHAALVHVVRQADPDFAEFTREESLECRLVGIRQAEGAEMLICPVEQLLLLRGGRGLPPAAQRLAAQAVRLRGQAQAYAMENVARALAVERRGVMLAEMPERRRRIERGFDFQAAELAAARMGLGQKARSGNHLAQRQLEEVKAQQRDLAARKARAVAGLQREPDLIAPGAVLFIAHALVVPSADPEERKQQDVLVEEAAMRLVAAHERAAGAEVRDVHSPELACAAGLSEHPGFDLLSLRPGGERRAIEVKGRAGTGDVEVSANEWAKAANLRAGYWLYVVYDCATPAPRLCRVQDPFGTLLAKAKGSVLVSSSEISRLAREG